MSNEVNEADVLEVIRGYDWKSAFAYAGEPDEYGSANLVHVRTTVSPASLDPFTRVDVVEVVEVVASSEGENDERSWLCVGKLRDGRYFLLDAGCDYTGWDCQASGQTTVSLSLDDLIRYGLGNDERDRLKLPLPPEARP